ncbi:MAG: hypothetical protein NVS3B10_31310 [Polyangiales bacterium]
MIAVSAESVFEWLGHHDLDVVGAGDDAVGLDARAVHRRLSGAEERPAERDVGGSALREARADELHAIADLDRARRHLGDLDERGNAVPLAPPETPAETECRNGREDALKKEKSRAQHARSF